MVDLKGIPFTDVAVNLIETSLINYKRFGGIEITISRWSEDHFVVAIEQTSAPTGRVLTNDELVNRADEIFKEVTPKGFSFHVISTPFMP